MGNDPKTPLGMAESFLKTHADLQVVEVIIADTTGILRGKWLPPSSLAKIYADGVRLPRSTFALDVWGQDVAASGLVFEGVSPAALALRGKIEREADPSLMLGAASQRVAA